MKRAIIIITAFVFVISMMGTVFAADTKMLNWTANTVLAKFGADKTIVKAVKAQNKKELSLSYIKVQAFESAGPSFHSSPMDHHSPQRRL